MDAAGRYLCHGCMRDTVAIGVRIVRGSLHLQTLSPETPMVSGSSVAPATRCGTVIPHKIVKSCTATTWETPQAAT